MTQTGSDHPFGDPLEDLTQDELDKRFNDIMKRFNTARRMQMDKHVLHQLDLLLVSIEMEKERRIKVDEPANSVVIDTDPIIIPKFEGFK
jgi:hypothetical protein